MVSSSILSQICNEGVYRTNAFHMLGLPTDASTKAIRRRKEDFDSAKELGAESWEREFPHWLGRLNTPTYQQVADAVTAIEDPRNRMIAELFWVWAIEDHPAAMEAFLSGHRDKALELWQSLAQSYERNRVIALHNLAVVYHALAIEEELSIIEGKVRPLNKGLVEEYWQKSLSYWKELVDNDDFWGLYEGRMREFDDPRLTSGFIYRIRQELILALSNINAQLALLYIQQGSVSDAQRLVGYMYTLCTSDEKVQVLETSLQSQEKHIENIIHGCQKKVKEDPAQGAACVEEILGASSNVVRAAECFFDAENSCRLRILSDIFEACNAILVAYGNKTENWYVCLKLNKRLLPLACTPELHKRAESNQQAIQQNLDSQIEDSICTVCGKKDGQKRFWGGVVRIHKQPVKLYGDVQRNYKSFGCVSYSTIEIGVPCCDKCKPLTDEQLLASKQLAGALKKGYHIGEKPSQRSMRKVWGLPGEIGALPKQAVGCLVPIVVMGILITLAGCALLRNGF